MCEIGLVRSLKIIFMGLDIVELIIAVEEEFKIYIPRDVASAIVNNRMLIDYVYSQTNNKSREEIAEKIWEILIEETGIERDKFNEESLFLEDMGLD